MSAARSDEADAFERELRRIQDDHKIYLKENKELKSKCEELTLKLEMS